MADFTDLELLSELRDALATPPARPDAASLARLHATLAELERESEPVSITAGIRHNTAQRSGARRRRRVTGRSSILVASALAAALTAGVAAAAVATNTLPGPTRAFAYNLGLPVTSPSLFRAEATESLLRQAIGAHDSSRARSLAQQLTGEMKGLDYSDLSTIRASADTLLVQLGLGLPTISTTSPSPLTTTVTVPSSSGTPPKVPDVTIPSVTTPSVSVPSVSVPSVTTPSASVPSVSIPPVTVPSIPVPKVTVPTIKLPALPSL